MHVLYIYIYIYSRASWATSGVVYPLVKLVVHELRTRCGKPLEQDWRRRNPTVFCPKAGTVRRGSRRSCRARELYDVKARSREKYVSHVVVIRGLKTNTTRYTVLH